MVVQEIGDKLEHCNTNIFLITTEFFILHTLTEFIPNFPHYSWILQLTQQTRPLATKRSLATVSPREVIEKKKRKNADQNITLHIICFYTHMLLLL